MGPEGLQQDRRGHVCLMQQVFPCCVIGLGENRTNNEGNGGKQDERTCRRTAFFWQKPVAASSTYKPSI